MQYLRALWDGLQAVLKFVGDIISTTLLIVFYFTIFALFAIPVRLFADFLRTKPQGSNYAKKVRQFKTLDSFAHEG